MSATESDIQRLVDELPGLDCGLCGFRTCTDLAREAASHAEVLSKCPHRSSVSSTPLQALPMLGGVAAAGDTQGDLFGAPGAAPKRTWTDRLGREYDFVLQTFPQEPGPRETMIPHNPMITREMEIQKGDVLIGRPMGMSCGCPITHCGVVMDVDPRTGVITWCVTGPLRARSQGFKDIGYYSAQAYEGLIFETRSELKIGGRYWFLPRRCMLQWRHSGLINFLSKTPQGSQVRIEGLMIG